MDIPRSLKVKRSSMVSLALVVMALSGCSKQPEAPRTIPSPNSEAATEQIQPTNVEILAFKFSPDVHTVPVGTIVSWVNRDPYFHTVTSGKTDGPKNEPDGKFDEDLTEEGDVINITFDIPGTYTYFCKQHNAMNAEISVS